VIAVGYESTDSKRVREASSLFEAIAVATANGESERMDNSAAAEFTLE
jgi:hypothetical protein